LLDLDDGSTVAANALIIASGVSYRTLDVPGAEDLRDAGVFYGASMHEARSYQGEHVAIVGAANSAGQAALHFARYASQVTMLVRGDSLSARMSDYLVKQIERTPEIVVRYRTQVAAVHGNRRLECVDVVTDDARMDTLVVTGLFVFIGARPHTEWLDGTVARDSLGFLLSGSDLVRGRTWKEERSPFALETSLPGVFAAGDVRAQSVKRVASAVGDGALAVHYVHQYLGL
ncbi:MAG TPA: NAD(P)/FAD-dependent oxidoreductase, partial [Acidimicrobiales bacterium]